VLAGLNTKPEFCRLTALALTLDFAKTTHLEAEAPTYKSL
jgi:hypothetical protein